VSTCPADYGRIERWHRKRRRVPQGKSWRARALRAERHVRRLRDQLARVRGVVEGNRRRMRKLLAQAIDQGVVNGDRIRRLMAQEGSE
jgi:hypothetical protein